MVLKLFGSKWNAACVKILLSVNEIINLNDYKKGLILSMLHLPVFALGLRHLFL